jgi:PIN domain nuclease of toxin-antitoxin system
MGLLLDTQVFLWFVWGTSQLGSAARALIEDPANLKFVSVVSIWEIAIKVGIGKLVLAKPLEEFLREGLDGNGFVLLPVERAHAVHLVTIPLHHRDPFDRMLVAQAMVEHLPLVSADVAFDAYPITRIW